MRMSDWSSDVCASDLIIKLPNQPRHVRQVEHPKFVDEAIAPKSLYMVDEEAGRIGNHVRQFGQARTHFSGGKLWFGGWGVEPFDGKRRSEEHTSELQSLMRISYAVFCLK